MTYSVPRKLGVSENLRRELSKLLTGEREMDGWMMLSAAKCIVWLLETHKEGLGIYYDYQESDGGADPEEGTPVDDGDGPVDA